MPFSRALAPRERRLPLLRRFVLPPRFDATQQPRWSVAHVAESFGTLLSCPAVSITVLVAGGRQNHVPAITLQIYAFGEALGCWTARVTKEEVDAPSARELSRCLGKRPAL